MYWNKFFVFSHAYITMSTNEMAEKALKVSRFKLIFFKLDHQMVGNRLLRVSFARKNYQRSNSGSLFREKRIGKFFY